MAFFLMCVAGVCLIGFTSLVLRFLWNVTAALVGLATFFGFLILCAAIGERALGSVGAGIGLISALACMWLWSWFHREPRGGPRNLWQVKVSRHPERTRAVQETPNPSPAKSIAQRHGWWKRLLPGSARSARAMELHEAWINAEAEADWAAVRISVARRSCERLLARTDEPGHEVAAAIRRNIPNAVKSGIEELQGLSASQRRARLEKLVEVLEGYAVLAEQCHDEGLKSSGSQLDVHLAHIANLQARRR
jgi:hypothetical protein